MKTNNEIKASVTDSKKIQLPACSMCYWVACAECDFHTENGKDSNGNILLYCNKHERNETGGCHDGRKS